jgi:hypothetical protein
VAAVASAISTALAWGPVLVPILLVIGAIGLLVGALVIAYKKFPAFAAFVDQTAHGFVVMADAIERAVTALQEFLGLNTHESDAFARRSPTTRAPSTAARASNDNAGDPTFLAAARPTTTGAGVGHAHGHHEQRQVK